MNKKYCYCLACIVIVFVDLPPLTSQLTTRALSHLSQAFRPSTSKTYSRMFRDFLGFLVAAGMSSHQITHQVVLAFMQFLLDNGCSHSNIANYLTGVRAFFVVHGCNTQPFRHEQIQLFLKFLKLNVQFQPKANTIITIQQLYSLISACDALPHSQVYKAVYPVAFFSFLRVSNLLPHSVKTFDPTRQLAIGDLFFSEQGVTILIKWSKTLQNRQDTTTVSLPYLGASPLCPVAALRALITEYPGNNNDPLFRIPRCHGLVPLTDSVARKHLKQVSTLIGVSPHFKFHDFRRAGSTWAFNFGVPLDHIKAHGTWASDCVWRYISSVPQPSSTVSRAFQLHLQS